MNDCIGLRIRLRASCRLQTLNISGGLFQGLAVWLGIGFRAFAVKGRRR